jgi:prepilin-type N-terminal cleavage/methylation domain-containing protein
MRDLKVLGFTLIELIVSLSLLSILALPLAGLLLSSVRYEKIAYQKQENLINAASALDLICGEIKASKGISSTSTASRLVLIFDSYSVSYDLLAEKVRRTKNSSVSYLNPDATIDRLSYSYPAATSAITTIGPKMSKTLLTLEASCRN